MITNPEWLKSEERPYFHQVSHACISKLVECMTKLDKDEIDADTSFKMEKQILTDEIDDPEFLTFAITNVSELFSYIVTGHTTIRVHRNDADEIWFDIDEIQK
jgi:hypothetical protein